MGVKKGNMHGAAITATLILLLLNSIGAVYGGLNFMLHPDGSSLGMSTAHLEHSVFKTYFIPGVILFVVNGLLSFVIAGLTVARVKHYSIAIIIQGVLLIGWLTVQILILRFVFILHIVMAIVGFALIATGVYLYKTNKNMP